jgi:hypothetical protein
MHPLWFGRNARTCAVPLQVRIQKTIPEMANDRQNKGSRRRLKRFSMSLDFRLAAQGT